MNLIRIQALKLHCHVGVPDEEIAQAQTIFMNVEIQPNFSFENLHDDISKTIDYAAVVQDIETLAHSKSWRLIETLAHATAQFLLEKYSITKISVEVKKHILPQTEFVSVCVTL